MAGAPLNNQNAAKGRAWRDAINRALEKRSRVEAKEALDNLAEKFLSKCDEGEMQAFRELGDRLDGKAPQAITGPEGEALEIRVIERVIVRE
jgi:hypothetical protein